MTFKTSSVLSVLLLIRFFCLFFVENTCNALSPHLVNFDNAKVALKAALGQNTGPLSVITITRSSVEQGTTELISHDEFKQVLRILYSLCAGKNAPFYSEFSDFHGTNYYAYDYIRNFYWRLTGGGSLSLNDISVTEQQKLDVENFCSLLEKYYNRYLIDSCNIVVFNEMFFSQERPLEKCQKDFINDKLLEFSVSAPHSFVYPNYLYTETRNVRGSEVCRTYSRMKRYVSVGLMDIWGDMSVIDDCKRELAIRGIFNSGNRNTMYNWQFLVNETYGICNGHIVTRYKKRSYFNESNDDVRRGVVYDFGKGKDISLRKTFPKNIRKTLLRNISTEICFDLANGVRKGNLWNNGGRSSLLHILQSNCIDPFDKGNISNLPLNVPIIYADSWLNYQKCGIPFYNGMGQEGELPLMSHGITIGDSLYTLGIYSR